MKLRRLLTRVRSDEHGLGLVELIVALVILNIGLLALVAAYSSGAAALRRGGQVATATALGERQLELYRGLRYSAIGLESGLVATANADAQYAASWPSGTADTTSCTDATRPECRPMQSVTGPDGRSYRIDSYVVRVAYSGTHTYKRVRVIVRDGASLATVLARHESTFDESTGL